MFTGSLTSGACLCNMEKAFADQAMKVMGANLSIPSCM